jgi:hypothetical protein
MEHFVTLLNNLFLPQLLALHISMERHIRKYTLWVVCVDDKAYKVLSSLKLSNIKLLQLSKLETKELKKIKAKRSMWEYCWTLSPFAPNFVFQADSKVKRVAYIDADLWFRKDPKPFFNELDSSGKAVLITDHAFAPEYDQSISSGQYCVQFIIFSRNGGEIVRKWWEKKCIEWCYNRVENGKFGDQKYLDCWPEKFGNIVHVLQNKELALAPWNATRFPFGQAIFYHFSGVRIISDKKVSIGDYILPDTLIFNVYRPYLKDINFSVNQLASIGFISKPQILKLGYIQSAYKRLARIYRLIRAYLRSNNMSYRP